MSHKRTDFLSTPSAHRLPQHDYFSVGLVRLLTETSASENNAHRMRAANTHRDSVLSSF
jgi:hypothetical protein